MADYTDFKIGQYVCVSEYWRNRNKHNLLNDRELAAPAIGLITNIELGTLFALRVLWISGWRMMPNNETLREISYTQQDLELMDDSEVVLRILGGN
jgi:hypothetical protein